MIELTGIRRIRQLARDPDVSCYAIVRSMTYPIANVSQMDILSPSRDLSYRAYEEKGGRPCAD